MRLLINHIAIGLVLLSLLSCKFEPTIVSWDDGIIPYYLSGDFTDSEIQLIKTAMLHWEQVCNVQFRKVTPRARAYNIMRIHETKWSSSIGENNSVCYMNFGDHHDPLPHILHELGHALGLLHEHQRPDRDLYISVIWNNIIPLYLDNFATRDNPLIIEENYPYDYQSIMHYSANSYSINGSHTLLSLDASQPINILKVITETDADKAREIYGPPKER